MEKIKIMALGGLDEEGKDLYVIEINGDIFVVGGGYKYPNKMTPGIDFIIADFTYLEQNKDRVKAYILPKGKHNVFGAIPYIVQKVPAPIYCTRLTGALLNKFTFERKITLKYEFKFVELPSVLKISGHEIELFSTCASMPNTFGFSIRTSLGNIVYSGDFIVEYGNDPNFKLDLNTLGKIAENPTLILLAESQNSTKPGYCSPSHKIDGYLRNTFKSAPGRVFVAVSSSNLYHFDEVFKVCEEFNKKICLYDQTSKDLFEIKQKSPYFSGKNIVEIDNILRIRDEDLVILLSDSGEKIYEKISVLANRENDEKQLRINENDTFFIGVPSNDNNEVIATDTIDEVYKSGCHVFYLTRKMVGIMHAYEEDLKMLLSLLKPKYYFPIEGAYVNLLANAKLAFEMHLGLTHNNIFLLDNGNSITIDENGASIDFNLKDETRVGDIMIDGIGVGDVVGEIIKDRSRLSEDGVSIFAIAVSKKERRIVGGPDIQMRGFLFLKDKEADGILKEMQRMFIEAIEKWLAETVTFEITKISDTIRGQIERYLLKNSNRNPYVKLNIIVLD